MRLGGISDEEAGRADSSVSESACEVPWVEPDEVVPGAESAGDEVATESSDGAGVKTINGRLNRSALRSVTGCSHMATSSSRALYVDSRRAFS